MGVWGVARIIDLSMTLYTGLPVFEGYPVPVVHEWTSIEKHGYYSNILILVEHTGTHVDAPAHFIERAPTIDEVPLDRFMGKGLVVDVSGLGEKEEIKPEHIIEAEQRFNVRVGEGWIVLFHTGYDRYVGSEKWYRHPGLGEPAARFLVERGVNAVGIDAPSIDHEPFPAHKTLLPNNIVIYENLTNLDKVKDKAGFMVYGFPLKIKKGSASPVRVIAVIE